MMKMNMRRLLSMLLTVVMTVTAVQTSFANENAGNTALGVPVTERVISITAILDEEELIQGFAYPISEFEMIAGIWFAIDDEGNMNEDYTAGAVAIYNSRTGEILQELGELVVFIDDEYGWLFIDEVGEVIQPFESESMPDIPIEFGLDSVVIYAGSEDSIDYWWVSEMISGRVWQIYAFTFSDVIICEDDCECEVCNPEFEIELFLDNQGITNERLAEMVENGEIPQNVHLLSLNENPISDFSPLAELPQLRLLYAQNSGISDLSTFSGITSLYQLYLSGNEISDLSPLSEMQFSVLSLSDNKISDLSPLSAMRWLDYLKLDNNQIRDLSPLSSLTELYSLNTLSLRGNLINELTPLYSTDVSYLYIHDNPVNLAQVRALEEALKRTVNHNAVCDCKNCTDCGFLGGHYGFGFVLNNENITILDVLEILKYLAELPNIIEDSANSRAAAIILNAGTSTEPTINDALEILKKLARLLNRIDIPNLADVRIEHRAIELRTDGQHTMRNNYRGTVRFESMNPQIAAVTRASGVVTAVSNGGETHILVYVNDVVRSAYRVVVLPSTTAVSIPNIPEVISVGESIRLNVMLEPGNSVDRVNISVNNDSRARVTRYGELRGLARGEVVLTVTSGRVSQNYTVMVEAPEISNSDVVIAEGGSFTLRMDGTQRAVAWTSTNPGVATVDQNGRITALKAGYTCIIAKIGEISYYGDVRVITPLEMRISDLQNKYPDGYFWNNHTPDTQFPEVSRTPCQHRVDSPRRCKGQCAGFAHLISNEVFGRSAPRIPVADVQSVRQGDYIRYSRHAGHNHSIFIIRVEHEGEIVGYDRRNGRHIYAQRTTWIVTDCNWWSDCGIIWYRRFNPETFVTVFNARESYSRF
jgi:Leucine-rich repeat (LRR) protein